MKEVPVRVCEHIAAAVGRGQRSPPRSSLVLLTFPPDFEALLRFIEAAPVVRQGCSLDIRYPGVSDDRSWSVVATFLDDKGGEFTEGAEVPVSSGVTARFHIIDRDVRETIHRPRLYVSTLFYVVDGSRTVALGAVTALLALARAG